MKPKRIRTWEELQALPEGQWVESAGLDFEVVDRTTRPARQAAASKSYVGRAGSAPRIVVSLEPEIARYIRPRRGEVLEVSLQGRSLEVERRKRKRLSGT